MDIAEFLLARIAEDEREANGHLGAEYYQDGLWPEDVAQRALRECATKRAIVDLHGSYFADNSVCVTCREVFNNDSEDYPCQTLRALAAVYSDHPDYQEKWSL